MQLWSFVSYWLWTHLLQVWIYYSTCYFSTSYIKIWFWFHENNNKSQRQNSVCCLRAQNISSQYDCMNYFSHWTWSSICLFLCVCKWYAFEDCHPRNWSHYSNKSWSKVWNWEIFGFQLSLWYMAGHLYVWHLWVHLCVYVSLSACVNLQSGCLSFMSFFLSFMSFFLSFISFFLSVYMSVCCMIKGTVRLRV